MTLGALRTGGHKVAALARDIVQKWNPVQVLEKDELMPSRHRGKADSNGQQE